MITQEQIRRARANGKAQPAFWQKTSLAVALSESTLSFQQSGIPAAGAYGGSLAPTQFIGDATSPSHASGLIFFTNAVSPEFNFLTFARGINTTTDPDGLLILVDLLVESSNFNGNTGPAEQVTGTSTGDNNLPRYPDGLDVYILGDVQTTLGGTSRGLTVRFTDQDGNSKTTTSVPTVVGQLKGKGIGANGPFLPFPAGVRGAKSVQGATLAVGGTGAGTFAIVLVKKLASIVVKNGIIEGDFVNQQPMLPKIEDDACLAWIWLPSDANTAQMTLDAEVLALDPDDLDA